MSHGDQVDRVSDDFVPLAKTATCPIAAVKHKSLPVYGVQFHPEVTHTPLGSHILHNFLTARLRLHAARGSWATSPSETIAADAAADRQATA